MHQLDVAEARGQKQPYPAVEQAVNRTRRSRWAPVGRESAPDRSGTSSGHARACRPHRPGATSNARRPIPGRDAARDRLRAEPVRDPDDGIRGNVTGDTTTVRRTFTQQRGNRLEARWRRRRRPAPPRGESPRARAQVGWSRADGDSRVVEQRIGEVVGRTACELAGGCTIGIAGQANVPDPIGADRAGAKPPPLLAASREGTR